MHSGGTIASAISVQDDNSNLVRIKEIAKLGAIKGEV